MADPIPLHGNAEYEFKNDAIKKFVVNMSKLCSGVALQENRTILTISEESKQMLEIHLPVDLVWHLFHTLCPRSAIPHTTLCGRALPKGWFDLPKILGTHPTFSMFLCIVLVVASHTPRVASRHFALVPLGMSRG